MVIYLRRKDRKLRDICMLSLVSCITFLMANKIVNFKFNNEFLFLWDTKNKRDDCFLHRTNLIELR